MRILGFFFAYSEGSLRWTIKDHITRINGLSLNLTGIGCLAPYLAIRFITGVAWPKLAWNLDAFVQILDPEGYYELGEAVHTQLFHISQRLLKVLRAMFLAWAHTLPW
jgi:hypothetical protein